MDAVDEALCCLLALFRAETAGKIVTALPDDRRRAIEEAMAGIADAPREEAVSRFGKLREADAAAAMARSGMRDQVAWTSLPKPLQQWLSGRGQETNG